MTRKIVLITGASRGLGRNAALQLAARGFDLIGTYHSRQDEARAVADEVARLGGRAEMLQLDVGAVSGFPTFARQVAECLEQRFGGARLYALVNNAGIGIHAPCAETTEAQFDQLLGIQLKGPFFLTQHLLPLLADGGRILNLSTGLARFSLPGYGAYAAMKGGVEVWTRYLARELGPRGIRVNVLAPGAIETDFGGGVVRDNAEVNSFVAANTALGRVGLPDDIGQAVALLLAEEAGWITGQRIEASGGMFL